MTERGIITGPEELRDIGKSVANDRELLGRKTDRLWEEIIDGCYEDIANALSDYDFETQSKFLARVLEKARIPNAIAIAHFLACMNSTSLPQRAVINRTDSRELVEDLTRQYLGIEDGLKIKFTDPVSWEYDNSETEKLLTHFKDNLRVADIERGLSQRRIRAIDDLLSNIVHAVDHLEPTVYVAEDAPLYGELIDLGIKFAARHEQIPEGLNNPGLRAMELAQDGLVPLGISNEDGPKSATKTLLVYIHKR